MDTTFGVEEELLVIDMITGDLSPHNFQSSFRRHPDYASFSSPELHAGTIEVKTGIHTTWRDLCCEIGANRRHASIMACEQGQMISGGGSHPWSDWRNHSYTQKDGAAEVLQRHQDAARGAMTFGMHMHVGVPEADRLKMYLGLRELLPLFLAVSANSPFFGGRETGLACWRLSQLDRYPRMGIPDAWESLEAYRTAVEKLEAKGLIRPGSMMWHDLRIHRHYNTLEIRVFDTQLEERDTASVAALVMLAVKAIQAAPQVVPLPNWQLLENRWLAMRHGVDAQLVDWRRDAIASVSCSIELLAEQALSVHSSAEVSVLHAAAMRLVEMNGAKRQLGFVKRAGEQNRLPFWMAALLLQGIDDER